MKADSTSEQKIPRMLLVVFVAFAIGIITCGYLYYTIQKKHFISEAQDDLKTIADLKYKELVNWRNGKLQLAKLFHNNNSFNRLVKKAFSKKTDKHHAEELDIWLNKLVSDHEIEDICISDVNSNKQINKLIFTIPISNCLKQKTTQVLKTGNIDFADFYINEYTHKILLSVIVPLIDSEKNKTPVGVLYLDIDPTHFLFNQLKQWPTNSETAESFIVRKDSTDVLFLSELRFRENTAMNLRIPLSKTDVPAVKAVLGETGAVDGTDYKGDLSMTFIKPIPDSPWFLIIRINKDEVLAPLQAIFRLIILLLFSLITASAAITIFIWRKQNLKFFREKLKVVEELQKSEAKFKQVFANASVGKAFIKPDGTLHINKAFCKIVGYSEEELNGTKWQDITHPDDIKLSEEYLKRLASNTLDSIRFEKKYVHKNGNIVWADVNIIAQRDQKQNVLFYYNTIQDVTERKLSQTQYSTIIQSSIDGFCIHDLYGNILEANASLALLLGCSIEELLQMKVADFDALETPNETLLRFTKIKETGHERFLTNYKRKDGTLLDVEVNVQYNAELGEKFFVFIRDITEQMQEKFALEESEEWFRSLFTQSDEGLVYMSAKGDILLANNAFALLHGYSIDEILLLNIKDLDSNNDETIFNERMMQLMQGKSVIYETNHYHKDGSIIPIEVAISTVEIGDDTYFMASHRNITERKKAELLAQTRLRILNFALYHSLSEVLEEVLNIVCELTNSPIGFYHFIEEDQKTISLQAWSTKTKAEYCMAQGEGSHYSIDQAGVWVDCIHHRKPVIHNDYKALPNKKGLPPGHAPLLRELVVPIFRNDLIVAVIGVGNKPQLYKDNEIEMITFIADVAWDVAERKIAEIKLQENEHLLNESQKASNIGSYVLNIIDGVWKSSATLNNMFGIADNEIHTVDSWATNIFIEDRQMMLKYFEEEVLGHKQTFDKEYRIQKKDTQEIRWVHGFGKLEFNSLGNPVKMLGTIQDITERKKTEAKIQQLIINLERSNKELEQFAFVASHDLQEPLRMISSYLQLLTKRHAAALDPEAIEFIDFAVEGSVRMQHLINDLLSYSRLNTQSKPFAMVDSYSIIGKVLINLKNIMDENNAIVTTYQLPKINCDEGQIIQLFQNLIINAIKYKGNDDPNIIITAIFQNTDWLFSVKDNGIGIDKEYHERIFGIFKRLHLRSEYSGNGIGLAICQRIIERHGGRIWVDSELNKGATFYFTLPQKINL